MKDWRNQVLKQFTTSNPLYIVLDEDGLLLDEKILARLQEKKIQVVNLHDSIRFRYEFESEYRTRVEQGDICLLIRAKGPDYNVFPYDLIQLGQQVRLTIAMIFPQFSIPIVRQLDVEARDALYAVHERYQGSPSDKETLDFLAKHVYKLPYEVVESRDDLWKLLVTIHHGADSLPEVVKEYVVTVLVLQKDLEKDFGHVSLHELVTVKEYFYGYLQTEWETFIRELSQLWLQHRDAAIEDSVYYATHPFKSPYMRGILDTLFFEHLIQPIEIDHHVWSRIPAWIQIGVRTDTGDRQKDKEKVRQQDRLEGLYTRLNEAALQDNIYKDWIKLAEVYGQFKHLAISTGIYDTQVNEIADKMDEQFERWMSHYYGALITLPYLPLPKMVHHIPHYIATQAEDRIALIVMDGMGFLQWVQIRDRLLEHGMSIEENGVFAWVPTLTSVSRQAIFSGLEPFYFPSSFLTTAKEPKLWQTFWEDHGISMGHVAYQKGLGREKYAKDNLLPFKQPNIRVYGAVIDVIDQALHGAIQGMKSVAAEINIWLETNYLYNFISDLMTSGYTVYLTADHGSRESVGVGRISEGVLVETKGERVRTYQTKELRNHTAEQNAMTVQWNDIGLPEHFHVLLAKGNAAFVNREERIVSHGGISIDEVVVPFVKVLSSL